MSSGNPVEPDAPEHPTAPASPTPDPAPTAHGGRGRERRGLAWPIALVAVTAILAATFVYVFQSLRDVPGDMVESGREAIRELKSVAAAFNQGTVELEFISHATTVSGQTYLQFATVKQTEIFRRTDSSSTLWGALPLPDVLVEATAPVETTYYLDLDERWEFEREGQTVRVLAPAPRFNTPSVDASQIRYEVREGSLFRDTEAAKERLQRVITSLAKRRAGQNLELVRELGRQKTEEFVETWLLGAFGDGGEYEVEVRFRDEVPGADTPAREVGREILLREPGEGR